MCVNVLYRFFFFFGYLSVTENRKRTCLKHEIAFHDHAFINGLDCNITAVGGVNSQLNLSKHTFPDGSADLILAYVVGKSHVPVGESQRLRLQSSTLTSRQELTLSIANSVGTAFVLYPLWFECLRYRR